MEGRTLAIAAFNTKLDDDFQIIATRSGRAREDRGRHAGGRGADRARHGSVRRRRARWTPTRSSSSASCARYLAALVEMAYQATGYRRVKNPRIWSLHDLHVLVGGAAVSGGRAAARAHLARSRSRRRATSCARPRPVCSTAGIAAEHLVAARRRDRRARDPRPDRSSSSRRASAASSSSLPSRRRERAVGYGDVLCRIVAASAIGTAAELEPASPPRPRRRPRVPRADERPVLRPARARQAGVRRRRHRARRPATTMCLLEVMKTFNRVTYGGRAGARARGARRRRRRRQRRRGATRARGHVRVLVLVWKRVST